MRLDEELRKIGSSGGQGSFPKMKGDDKKHEIRFKQIERTLKNKKFIKEIESMVLYMYDNRKLFAN